MTDELILSCRYCKQPLDDPEYPRGAYTVNWRGGADALPEAYHDWCLVTYEALENTYQHRLYNHSQFCHLPDCDWEPERHQWLQPGWLASSPGGQ